MVVKEPWNARLGADRAARVLQARLHTTVRYRCESADDDETIALQDVDYLCEPIGHPERQGYWISTNDRRITGMQSTG